jgi:hypothetical protein
MMSKQITWTEEEFREFEELVDSGSSRSQLERIHSRIHMPAFIEKHGREKCDAMFAVLTEGEAK